MLVWNLKGTVVDIETAFLHGELKEKIYMHLPDGLEGDKQAECLSLKKTIYGLVQSAREFNEKLGLALKECGFKENSVDPCLFTNFTKNGIGLVGIYVDDCMVIGCDEDIKKVIKRLKGYGFGLKVEEFLTDYLSCKVMMNRENAEVLVMQPHFLKGLEDKSGEEVNNLSSYATPGTPRFKVVKSNDVVETIAMDKQSRYRSGVGILLYLIKYSRPDIANMDGANLAAYKEMLRVIKFVLDTKEYCLKLAPELENEEWDMVSYSDCDWAGNPDSRISVTGFVIYLLGAPICWRSKGQKGVTLSSSEAEYVAMSETVKQIRFIYYLLPGMGVQIKLPIVVRCDNIGAIFMAENSSSGVRTRHIDTRYHFVREHVVNEFIKIIFVKSNENEVDMFTKNIGKEIYEKHVKRFLGKDASNN
jgi:Reverse transcriptase (RNA-dependent DNA polymerase)